MTMSNKINSTVTVRVPATTANCGAGFDCLGIACTMYNTFTFTIDSEKNISVIAQGEGSSMFKPHSSNLVIESFYAVYDQKKLPRPGIKLQMNNSVPLARGLGSSSSAIVAGIVAANYFTGSTLTNDDLLNIATNLEGHPDNVAPALLGGIIVSYMRNSCAGAAKLPCPNKFKLVAVVPELKLETKLARSVLPEQVPRHDAIFNLSRAALFVSAISTGKLEMLSDALHDTLHQPYRSKLIPHMQQVFDAAISNGAYGAVISGAGSTLMAFCPLTADCTKIGDAMQAVFAENSIPSKYHILDVDTQGAKII